MVDVVIAILIIVSPAIFFGTGSLLMFVKSLMSRGQKKPLELPEWTGRERESLRADLEAAVEGISEWSDHMVIVNKNGYPWITPTAIRANKYGLFPEALEAYIEEQK